MTDHTAPLPEDDDQALAAEVALGVLEGQDYAAAQRRLARDPAFAALVRAWETRLAPLAEEVASVPAPDLLPRIEARLFPQPRQDLRFRIGAMIGAAAASLAVIALAVVFFAVPPAPAVSVHMQTADAAVAYDAVFDGTQLTVVRSAGQAAPTGQVHELWIIAPGSSPVSLGLLQDRPLVVAYPTPPAGWTLAVSVEPAGGAPDGSPTGPVVMATEISL